MQHMKMCINEAKPSFYMAFLLWYSEKFFLLCKRIELIRSHQNYALNVNRISHSLL
jgi:hypothetical protein